MRYTLLFLCIITFSTVLATENAKAQGILNRAVTVKVNQVKLSSVLTDLGKKGNFYFSYSNDQIKADSLVTLSVENKALSAVLDAIFNSNVDYKESAGYIILRATPKRLTLKPDTSYGKDYNYYISGYVIDDRTGLAIPNASVYEKRLLVSTLTDEKGFFSIKLKSDGQVILTVSKELYKDSSVSFLNDVTISLKHRNDYYSADTSSGRVEGNWLGRMFIQSRQRIQSLNLGGYMATVPFQTSFTPGLSTHGMMSSQVVNHYSFNVLGGYTAGLNGLELGGLFNINKQDVKYVQAAGLFNVVGGNFEGVQFAGIGNTVFKNVKGLQAAGIYNVVKDTVKGVQLAGIFNKSRVMKGLSISVVNITDTLEGFAIGLVNLSPHGYHKILIYTNEVSPFNAAFKTGNAKLYSLLTAGAKFTGHVQFYSFGLGIGHDFILSRQAYLSAEIATQSLQSAHWKDSHQISKLSTLLNVKTGSKLALFAGPSINLYHFSKNKNHENEDQHIVDDALGLVKLGNGNSWIGWSAGIAF